MPFSRLASLTTVTILILILGMYFYTQKGFILFAPFIAVAGMALILWLRFDFKINPNRVIVPFIFAIMGLILLNTLRFLAGFASIGSTLFNAAFLFGGYYLLKRAPIGSYITWFVFLWSIFQGLLQFYMAIVLKNSYVDYYYLGISAGIIVLTLGLSGIYCIFRRTIFSVVNIIIPNRRIINLWTAFSLNIAVLYSIIILSSQPYPTPELILCWISLIVGVILWRKTASFNVVNAHKILPAYLLMLALYLLYFQESEIAQYEEHLAILFKINTQFPLIYSLKLLLMLFGAISLYWKKPIGKLITIVASLNIIITQPIIFFLFPLLESIKNNSPFHYFPGMWTALLAMIPALNILYIVFQEYLSCVDTKFNKAALYE